MPVFDAANVDRGSYRVNALHGSLQALEPKGARYVKMNVSVGAPSEYVRVWILLIKIPYLSLIPRCVILVVDYGSRKTEVSVNLALYLAEFRADSLTDTASVDRSQLMARLMYGADLRLMELLRLRVQDVNFE